MPIGSSQWMYSAAVDRDPVDLTAQGNAQHSTDTKKIGDTSLKFDGSGDYISSPSDDRWNWGTGAFTVEFWLYTSSGAGSNNIIIGNSSLETADSKDTHWRIFRGLGDVNELIFGTGASWQYNGTSTYSNDTWTHVAYTRDSSGDGRLFYNGTIDATGVVANSKDYSGTNELWFGKAYDGNEFNGYLDEVRISNVCRYDADFTDFGQSGGTISSPTAFVTDANTFLLVHSNTTNASTTFTDSSSE